MKNGQGENVASECKNGASRSHGGSVAKGAGGMWHLHQEGAERAPLKRIIVERRSIAAMEMVTTKTP